MGFRTFFAWWLPDAILSISAASATLAISMLFASVGARIGFCEEPFIPYQVTEDVVYGHKDGLALTLDVLEPTEKPNHIGLILISSGSWNSRKSDVHDECCSIRHQS